MRMNVNFVLVPVSVTDLKNQPVMNLQREDFTLFQDGQPQRVEYFSTEDVPISVGLILDVSKSMTSKFEKERAAVTEFFRNANERDDYFAIAFSDRPKLVVRSTEPGRVCNPHSFRSHRRGIYRRPGGQPPPPVHGPALRG